MNEPSAVAEPEVLARLAKQAQVDVARIIVSSDSRATSVLGAERVVPVILVNNWSRISDEGNVSN